jgi:signal transduction histidine kinase
VRAKPIACVARLLVAVVSLWITAVPLHAAERETRVLFINGVDPTLPAFLIMDRALRDTLARNPTQRFQFFSEALDSHRFAFGDFEQEFLALLRKKYKGVSFDVVVPVSERALNFVRSHRSELWPDAWVFFHSVPPRAIEGIEPQPRTAGIIARRTLSRTLELARTLQPNAARVLFVAGVAESEKEGLDLARSAFAALPPSIEVEYALGVPLPELIELVKRQRSDTMILYYTQFRDRDGRPYVPRDVLRAISAVSPAPIYSPFESHFDQGMVAGITESYTNRGRLAAERLRQLAAGESIPSLSVIPDFCAADARLLRKFSINESRLPEGCEILFAERSLWREYRWQILGALAVLLFQTLLIAGLLIERGRRQHATARAGKATAESGQYRESLAHLVRVHTVGEMSTAIAHEVNQPLAAIKNYAFAAQRWLTQVGGVAKVGELLNKIEEQATRAGDVLHSLRTMVKKHDREHTEVEVGPLVAETLKLVEFESRAGDIQLESSIAPNLPSVFVDSIQIQQVVLNLTRNAIEAMKEAGHTGTITVGVQDSGQSEIAVSVADRGPGVAPADAERVFDPFYSTKGSGLGVGLSICRAIVEAHGGHLSLAPNAEGGSIFRFTLPAMKT